MVAEVHHGTGVLSDGGTHQGTVSRIKELPQP